MGNQGYYLTDWVGKATYYGGNTPDQNFNLPSLGR
jgi:hypothetical protein